MLLLQALQLEMRALEEGLRGKLAVGGDVLRRAAGAAEHLDVIVGDGHVVVAVVAVLALIAVVFRDKIMDVLGKARS